MSGAITAVAERGAAGLFGTLAQTFQGRPLHPAGVAFSATLRVAEASAPELALFAEPGEHAASVRFSRGFGLPEPLPEILSLAVKVPGAYGPGEDQDFLMTASYGRPGLRHVFAAGRSHLTQTYSTVVPFSAAGRTVVFGAAPHPVARRGGEDLGELERHAAAGELMLDLRVATLTGPWRTLGVLEVGRALTRGEERALTFNSDTTGGGIAATGFINRLRGAAYDAAARARPTTGQEPA